MLIRQMPYSMFYRQYLTLKTMRTQLLLWSVVVEEEIRKRDLKWEE